MKKELLSYVFTLILIVCVLSGCSEILDMQMDGIAETTADFVYSTQFVETEPKEQSEAIHTEFVETESIEETSVTVAFETGLVVTDVETDAVEETTVFTTDFEVETIIVTDVETEGVSDSEIIAETETVPVETEPVETEHAHVFSVATCTAPKTCDCGATDGKASGHNWKNATCTEPKTCKVCGVTDGKANGHDWRNATCSEPKTCTVCKETSGSAQGHNYSSGKCTDCGKADPYYSYERTVWIPTKGGKKYHSHPGCSNMDGPREVTVSEAEALGFTPCKKC